MSELKEIHEKINKTNATLARIEGHMTHLASKEDLSQSISTHVKDEHARRVPPWDRILAPLISAIVAFIGLVGVYYFTKN